jgi:hypothetical protein
MLNLSEIHPDVRRTLHEMENALARDVSPNTGQADVGKAIKDTYAKSSWVRMFSPIDSTLEYVYYTEENPPPAGSVKNIGDIKVDIKLDDDGKIISQQAVTQNNPRGGMDTVCIMGGELMKEGEGADTTFKHLSGFREMYDRSLFDKGGDGILTPEGNKIMFREDRFRPLPGITSVSVEFAGSTKAIRNATVNWVCHSYTDIGRLTPHFLGHGKPVVLEWGWSSVGDFSDVTFFSKEDIKDGTAYEEIQDMIWKNKGKYDAMAGLIKNFEWKTRDDGGFDCITEITSLGVNTLGQQTKSEIAPAADGSGRMPAHGKKDEDTKVKETKSYAPTLEQFVEQLDEEIKNLVTTPGTLWGTNPLPASKQPPGILRPKLTKGAVSYIVGPYVSWGWMEDNIISKFLGKVNSNGKLLSTFRSLVPIMEGGKPKLGWHLDQMKWRWESVKICNHEHLLTSNPQKFIFLGQWFHQSNMDYSKDYDTYRTRELRKYLEDAAGGKGFSNFAVPDDPTSGYLRNIIIHWEVIKQAFTGITSVESGMQNMFNQLNEEYGIWKFKITDATFPSKIHGVGRVMVIDENYSENKVTKLLGSGSDGVSRLVDGNVEGKLFVFNVMNEKSLVKGHSLTAKLPSSMQTAAMFGANSKGSAPSVAGNPSSIRYGKSIGKHPDKSIGDMKMAWEYSTFGYSGDRFTFDDKDGIATIMDANLALSNSGGPELMITTVLSNGTATDSDSDEAAEEAKNEAERKEQERNTQESLFITNLTAIKNYAEGGVEDSTVHEKIYSKSHDERRMYDDYGALKTEGTYKWNEIMRSIITTGPTGSYTTRPLLIPLEIEIQLTGIGGIVPGNAFTTNYLPPEYHGWVAFQAIDISHSIGTDGWVTTIRGLMRMAEKPPVLEGEMIEQVAEATSTTDSTTMPVIVKVPKDEVLTAEITTLEKEVDTANTEAEIQEGGDEEEVGDEEEAGVAMIPTKGKTRTNLGLNQEFTLERKPRADYKPANPPPKKPKILIPGEEEDIEGDVEIDNTEMDAFLAEQTFEEPAPPPPPPPPPTINTQIPATYEFERISETSSGEEYTSSFVWTIVYEAVEYRTFSDGSVKETNRATGQETRQDREQADVGARQKALGNAGHWAYK